MVRKLLFGAAVAVLLVAATGASARAEQPSVAVSPRDTVKLKSGAVYTGVITELIPNVSVEIVLVSGETRKLAMSDVVYAGRSDPLPGAAPPTPAAPPAAQQPRSAPVQFRAEGGDGITLKVVTGSAFTSEDGEVPTFQSLCTAPCSPQLAPGTYRLALSNGGKPVVTPRVSIPATPSTIHGTYTSRSGLHYAGIIAMVVGPLASLPLMLDGARAHGRSDGEIWAGTGVLLGSLLGGLILIALGEDSAKIEVLPGVAGLPLPAPGTRVAEGAIGPGDATGLTLRLRF